MMMAAGLAAQIGGVKPEGRSLEARNADSAGWSHHVPCGVQDIGDGRYTVLMPGSFRDDRRDENLPVTEIGRKSVRDSPTIGHASRVLFFSGGMTYHRFVAFHRGAVFGKRLAVKVATVFSLESFAGNGSASSPPAD
jgi:hypothetical protein